MVKELVSAPQTTRPPHQYSHLSTSLTILCYRHNHPCFNMDAVQVDTVHNSGLPKLIPRLLTKYMSNMPCFCSILNSEKASGRVYIKMQGTMVMYNHQHIAMRQTVNKTMYKPQEWFCYTSLISLT